MSSHYWIKLYHEILDDPKMGRLPDRAWRRCVELLLMAGEEANGGNLPDTTDIAWRLRAPIQEVTEDLAVLEAAGIIKQTDGGWLVMRFEARQGPVNDAERQRRARERKQRAEYYAGEDGSQDSHGPVTNRDADKIRLDIEAKIDTDTEHTPPAAADIDSDAEFNKLFPKPERGPPSESGRNVAEPFQAGGAHSPAEAIVDGMCRYNGLSQGIGALSEKDRRSWVRRVAEMIERYGATTEQANLAWQAYTIRFSFKQQASPFYASFASELGPLLAGVKAGDITVESFRAEARKGKKEETGPRPRDIDGEYGGCIQH